MTTLTAEQLALAFVDRLVPDHFDEARRMLHPSCEYSFGGDVLRGEEIVEAFEKSDEEAKKKFERIEYLPGRVAAVEGTVVVVQVFDRVTIADRTHTYSDRLVITLDPRLDRPVLHIEHRPFPEERAKLAAFLVGPSAPVA